jgi:aryl-phospho-beta-D-glucosidase BglC (GH1 family)
VVSAIGKHEGVYVLLALRSDQSMIGQDTQHGNPEATGIPSDSKTTPDKAKFPTGTDALYIALVNAFKNDKFVAFGLTNEPGGNLLSNDQIRSALDHAVGTIRQEEDKLGVPHHIVAVQGQGWTSDIGFYADEPLAYDNVVYEVHGYPPSAASYTYANIPVIVGEYGTLDAGSAPGFFADLETKQLSSLAWDFDPYSDCAPDLLDVNHSSTDLIPSSWGKLVQAYLLAHAK